jgi:hypothetical protein
VTGLHGVFFGRAGAGATEQATGETDREASLELEHRETKVRASENHAFENRRCGLGVGPGIRYAYALMKQQQAKSLPMKIRFAAIRGSFEILWSALTGEDAPIEGTPEWDAFKDAASRTAAEYIQLYGVEIGDHFTPNPEFTRIEILANDIIKSHRDFSQLTREEKDFVQNWIGVLREHYGSSV